MHESNIPIYLYIYIYIFTLLYNLNNVHEPCGVTIAEKWWKSPGNLEEARGNVRPSETTFTHLTEGLEN